MAKKDRPKAEGKTLLITVPENGEPQFAFTGIWTPVLLERMSRKAHRALRTDRIRKAQEHKALVEGQRESDEADTTDREQPTGGRL